MNKLLLRTISVLLIPTLLTTDVYPWADLACAPAPNFTGPNGQPAKQPIVFTSQALAEQEISSHNPTIGQPAVCAVDRMETAGVIVGPAYVNPEVPPDYMQLQGSIGSYMHEFRERLTDQISQAFESLSVAPSAEIRARFNEIAFLKEKLPDAKQWARDLESAENPLEFLQSRNPLTEQEKVWLETLRTVFNRTTPVIFVEPGSWAATAFHMPALGGATVITHHRSRPYRFVLMSRSIVSPALAMIFILHELLHVESMPDTGFKTPLDISLHEGLTQWKTREMLAEAYLKGSGPAAAQLRSWIQEGMKFRPVEGTTDPRSQFNQWFQAFCPSYSDEVAVVDWLHARYPKIDLDQVYQTSDFGRLYRRILLMERLKRISRSILYSKSIFHPDEVWRLFRQTADQPARSTDREFWRAARTVADWGDQQKGRLILDNLFLSTLMELPSFPLLLIGFEYRLQKEIYKDDLFPKLVGALIRGTPPAAVLEMARARLNELILDQIKSETANPPQEATPPPAKPGQTSLPPAAASARPATLQDVADLIRVLRKPLKEKAPYGITEFSLTDFHDPTLEADLRPRLQLVFPRQLDVENQLPVALERAGGLFIQMAAAKIASSPQSLKTLIYELQKVREARSAAHPSSDDPERTSGDHMKHLLQGFLTQQEAELFASLIDEKDGRGYFFLFLKTFEASRKSIVLAAAPLDLVSILQTAFRVWGRAPDAFHVEWDLPTGPVYIARREDEHEPDGRLKLQVLVDEALENAFRYTPEGGTIHIRLSVQGSHAELSISDTGIGIAAEDLPRVWDPFHRGREAEQRYSLGSGMGMTHIRRIAEEYGGSADVKSQLGQGTTLTVKLPAGPVADEGARNYTPENQLFYSRVMRTVTLVLAVVGTVLWGHHAIEQDVTLHATETLLFTFMGIFFSIGFDALVQHNTLLPYDVRATTSVAESRWTWLVKDGEGNHRQAYTIGQTETGVLQDFVKGLNRKELKALRWTAFEERHHARGQEHEWLAKLGATWDSLIAAPRTLRMNDEQLRAEIIALMTSPVASQKSELGAAARVRLGVSSWLLMGLGVVMSLGMAVLLMINYRTVSFWNFAGSALCIPLLALALYDVALNGWFRFAMIHPQGFAARTLRRHVPWLRENFFPYSNATLDQSQMRDFLKTFVGPGSRVASVGPGAPPDPRSKDWEGRFERLALELGASVRLYEANPKKQQLWRPIAEWLRRPGWGELTVARGEEASFQRSTLPRGSLDAVILFSVFSDISIMPWTKRQIARKVVESLKPGGHLLVGWYGSESTEWVRTARYVRYVSRYLKETGSQLVAVADGIDVDRSDNPFLPTGHIWVAYRVEPIAAKPAAPAPISSLRSPRAIPGAKLEKMYLAAFFPDKPLSLVLSLIILFVPDASYPLKLTAAILMSFVLQHLTFWIVRLFHFRQLSLRNKRLFAWIYTGWWAFNALLGISYFLHWGLSESPDSMLPVNNLEELLQGALTAYVGFNLVSLFLYRLLYRDSLMHALFGKNNYWAPVGGALGVELRRIYRFIKNPPDNDDQQGTSNPGHPKSREPPPRTDQSILHAAG